MTRSEFVHILSRLTATLPKSEQDRLLQYCGEMIDDSMEEGLSEAEAVARLGSPEALAEMALSGADIPERHHAAPAGVTPPEAATFAQEGANVMNLEGQLRHLEVQLLASDIKLRREALSGGVAMQIRLSDPQKFTCRLLDDTLRIEEKATRKPWSLTLSGEEVTVLVADAIPGRVLVESRSGDIEATGIDAGEGGSFTTASGDMTFDRCAFSGELEIRTRSGDVELRGLACADVHIGASSGDVEISGTTAANLSVNATSGDLDLRGLHADALSLNTTSGDIEVDRGQITGLALHAVSGDVRLNELICQGDASVETVSGDVDFIRSAALRLAIHTVSGDVSMKLPDEAGIGYDVQATNPTGDIRFSEAFRRHPDGSTTLPIEIKTASGGVQVDLAR